MANLAYNEKVWELFRNPKNMGKIENADGVGKLGNPVCLLPSQNIHMNSEPKEINNILCGELVMSHDGLYHSVTQTAVRNYSGEIVSIRNQMGIITLTPEHLVLAIKIPKGDRFKRTMYRKNLVPSWFHAADLRKGDIVLYPLSKVEKDCEYIEINVPRAKWDFKSKNIPREIPVNSDLLRLFGYFLSEGNICDKPCKTHISFTLNIKERDIADDISRISRDLFGLVVSMKEKPERKTLVVSINNAVLARFFKQIFGNGADRKSIPDLVMKLPKEKQKHLIYGLWKGDGYLNLDRDGPRAGYVTISKTLSQQIKMLLLRQNIALSLYEEKEKIIMGVRHKRAYRIHVGQRESLKKLCAILKIKYEPKSYASEKLWFDDKNLYAPITRVTKRHYDGNVYNLEVSESHSFLSEAFCLHNCGDVMVLYIKVKKNKIADIKFETFGCAAAIATSSMITELAKGKTIKEAIKITRDDVSGELGELPPIKEHCSNLAADALTEAIYDYMTREKAEIPPELEERHRKIHGWEGCDADKRRKCTKPCKRRFSK